jgi:hypothetical protein
MILKLNLGDSFAQVFKEMAKELEDDLNKAVYSLAVQTKAQMNDKAGSELSDSVKRKFSAALKYTEPAPNVHVISLDEEAMWIEEGIKPNTDMKPGLLKNAKHTSKDGHKYTAIPFDKGKGPTYSTPTEQEFTRQVRSFLKSKNIMYSPGEHAPTQTSRFERNADGSPRVGKIHAFDIKSRIPGKGNTPALFGLSIYQTVTKTGNVKRDILTFRTVSGGPASAGKWFHPGYKGHEYFEEAYKWASDKWEKEILPALVEKWK